MNCVDIYDLKELTRSIGNNFSINEKEEKIVWNNIKIFKVQKGYQHSIFYKTSFDAKDFDECNVRRKMRGHPPLISALELKKAFQEPPPITKKKKKHLLSLCKGNLIPKVHHKFYEDLKVSDTNRHQDENNFSE